MQDSRKSITKSTYRGHSINLLFKANLVDLLASLAPSITQKGDENQVSIKNHRMQRATCIDEQIEVGLHLLLETRFDPSLPSRDLDWLGEFHQVLLVTSPDVCFGVGGSLDPDHGLSSSYSDAKKGVYVVINEPPATVENMEELMVSFCYGGGRWKRMSTYE